MRVFVSEQVEASLLATSDPVAVLGTVGELGDVVTVTGTCEVGSESRVDAAGHVRGIASNRSTRQVLGVLGAEDGAYPLGVHRRGGKLEWVDGVRGRPARVFPYSADDFFRRTPFDPDIIGHLQAENVLVVGAGSVGAHMALELARTGVGSLTVVDKDRLEPHNCMRHILGSAFIGWPKAAAVAEYLREHAPFTKCLPVDDNLFGDDRRRLRDLLSEVSPSRVVAATDSLAVQYLCQLIALHLDIPLMAVWCDNNAVEGEVFLWEPGQASGWRPGRPMRGCYACMRNPDEVTVTRSANFDYSSDDPDSYGGEPALGSFIGRINMVATIFMTAWMLRGCSVETQLSSILDDPYDGKGLQYIRLGGPYPLESEGQVTAKNPWAVEWYRVLRRNDCQFCSLGADQIEEKLLRRDGGADDSWENLE